MTEDLTARLGRGRRRARVPFVQAQQTTDCAAACLAMVLAHHGRSERLDELRRALGIGRDGASAAAIVRVAEQHGLRARGVRVDPGELHLLPPATILHWEFNHFVVLERVGRAGATIVDPSLGRRVVALDRLRRSFTGVAIELVPGDRFELRAPGRSPVWGYLRQLLAQREVVVPILVGSAILRLLALALPALTAVVVDHVVPRADAHLLWVVAAGMLVAAAFGSISQLIRSQLLLELRTNLDVRLTVGFLQHLVRLPFEFFGRRSAGDLMQRVASNTTIREMLTSETLSALLDGLLILLYLALVAVVSPRMAAVVLGLGMLQVVVFVLSRRHYRELMTIDLEAQAKLHGHLVQMIGGIQSLKVAGAEARSVARWYDLFVDELDIALRRGRLGAWVDAGLDLLRGISPLVVLALGTQMVLAGQMSLGTMLAVASLATGFLAPLGAVVSGALQLQMLGSYVDRIDDVLQAEPEQTAGLRGPMPRLHGAIELAGVTFRYAPGAPAVLRDVSLTIPAGACVAIVGPSGAGKSTLANLLVGLYRPSEGAIRFDGHDLQALDVGALRRQIGVVPQHPYVFGTSIRDNITMGDDTLGLDAVITAAKAACIHDDVMAMPMGYDTIVADGGASLSGGQRQRIALARALVRKPAVLLLDEATSALDAATERAVTENLQAARCTRVIIAHRLSTIAAAETIVVLGDGAVVEVGSHERLMQRSGPYRSLVRAQLGGAEA